MLEHNASMKSSKDGGGQVLARVRPHQAEKFLEELANLRADIAAINRFQARFESLIPDPGPKFLWADPTSGEQPSDEKIAHRNILFLRELVRLVWLAPDLRSREWRILSVLRMIAVREWTRIFKIDTTLARLPEQLHPHVPSPELMSLPDFNPPPLRPFEQILFYLQKSTDRLRYCQGGTCSAPYFFAKRRNQKYCSDACAIPAKRQAKLRWWTEHGDARRRERGKTKRKSAKRTGKKGG